MNRRAPTFAAPFALDRHAGASGGLSAFALFYLGYAYVYFYLLAAGGP